MKPTKYSKPKSSLPKNRLIIGRKPLIEAIEAGVTIDKIFIQQQATGEEINQIKKRAKELTISISLVPPEKLNRLCRTPHQGVIGIGSLIQYHDLQTVISNCVDAGNVPLFILIDGITDTRNVGAIARSAHCYGAHGIILPLSNSALITEDSIKASAGALEHLPVCKVPSVEQAIDTLHLNGIQVLGTSLQGESLSNISHSFNDPVAIVMGSEDKGVSGYVLKKADSLFKIPMASDFDSLNVSVATGIILYACYQQRTLN